MKSNLFIAILTLIFYINLPTHAIHINKPTEELDKLVLQEAIANGFIAEKNKKIVIKSIYPILRLANREDILKCLFKLGLDINLTFYYMDSKWETLLMIASGRGDAPLVAFLLSQGASMEIKDFWKETALMHAVYRGYNDVIGLLVQKGATFDQIVQDKIGYGNMPLYYCLLNDNVEAMKIFIEKGLSEKSKIWSLVFAIFKKNKAIVELLIKDGVNLDTLEFDTAVDVMGTILARESEKLKLCARIRETVFGVLEYDLPYILLIAMFNDKAIAKLLLDSGANPNVTVDNDKKLSILTAFVKQNDIEAATLLLSYGANVNAKDLFGRSSMDFAISQSNNEMINLLLKYGAESYYPKS